VEVARVHGRQKELHTLNEKSCLCAFKQVSGFIPEPLFFMSLITAFSPFPVEVKKLYGG